MFPPKNLVYPGAVAWPQYGCYGYRQVTAAPRRLEGEPQRVERLWRQEGLKVPKRPDERLAE
jgi:hypothetical protein